ncbi:hypothetical protein PCE1_004085 [Barthelona sp. PCE]
MENKDFSTFLRTNFDKIDFTVPLEGVVLVNDDREWYPSYLVEELSSSYEILFLTNMIVSTEVEKIDVKEMNLRDLFTHVLGEESKVMGYGEVVNIICDEHDFIYDCSESKMHLIEREKGLTDFFKLKSSELTVEGVSFDVQIGIMSIKDKEQDEEKSVDVSKIQMLEKALRIRDRTISKHETAIEILENTLLEHKEENDKLEQKVIDLTKEKKEMMGVLTTISQAIGSIEVLKGE